MRKPLIHVSPNIGFEQTIVRLKSLITQPIICFLLWCHSDFERPHVSLETLCICWLCLWSKKPHTDRKSFILPSHRQQFSLPLCCEVFSCCPNGKTFCDANWWNVVNVSKAPVMHTVPPAGLGFPATTPHTCGLARWSQVVHCFSVGRLTPSCLCTRKWCPFQLCAPLFVTCIYSVNYPPEPVGGARERGKRLQLSL